MVKRVSNRKAITKKTNSTKRVSIKKEKNSLRVVVRRGKNKTNKEQKKINRKKEIKVSKQKKNRKQTTSKKQIQTKEKKKATSRKPRNTSKPKAISISIPHTPIINIGDILSKKISDFTIMDILSILEIGTYPTYYNESNSNAETKSFWDTIISHYKYRYLFSISPFNSSLNLSSDNIRRFFSSLKSYDPTSLVQLLQNNKAFLISKQDSINLLTISDYIKTIINGNAKTMSELDSVIEIKIEKDTKVIERDEIKELIEKDLSFAKTLNQVTETIASNFPLVDKSFINKMLLDNYTNIAMTYKILKDNTI